MPKKKNTGFWGFWRFFLLLTKQNRIWIPFKVSLGVLDFGRFEGFGPTQRNTAGWGFLAVSAAWTFVGFGDLGLFGLLGFFGDFEILWSPQKKVKN